MGWQWHRGKQTPRFTRMLPLLRPARAGSILVVRVSFVLVLFLVVLIGLASRSIQ
jgi:hypothetical protein